MSYKRNVRKKMKRRKKELSEENFVLGTWTGSWSRVMLRHQREAGTAGPRARAR